jgi:hypothetical protein
LKLGAALGEAALAGRDKVTLVLSRDIASFGLWVEQLIAESTGKEGKGLVPVAEGSLGPASVYGPDRLFVAMTLAGQRDDALTARLGELEAAGHPVVRIELKDRYDIGAEFFRWPFAVAVAGAVLGINPFDQPDVAAAKAGTDAVLARGPSATRSPAGSAADVKRHLKDVGPGHYLGLLAYLPPTAANDRRLAAIQSQLRDRLGVAVTVGYGPRYLHSTGQLHKGGPTSGRFVLITPPPGDDQAIPEKPYGFARLEAAQAEADLMTLQARGRPALRIESLDLLEATASAG